MLLDFSSNGGYGMKEMPGTGDLSYQKKQAVVYPAQQ
jgi:hypothetical protein